MEFIVRVTAGAGGTASGNTETFVKGFLESVQYSYSNGAANTTTITITEGETSRAIFAVGAGNTNGVAYPRAAAVNQSNAAITGSWASIYLSGHKLTVAIASANQGDVVTVRFVIRDRTDVE